MMRRPAERDPFGGRGRKRNDQAVISACFPLKNHIRYIRIISLRSDRFLHILIRNERGVLHAGQQISKDGNI